MIEKQYGKGAIMKLGDANVNTDIEIIPNLLNYIHKRIFLLFFRLQYTIIPQVFAYCPTLFFEGLNTYANESKSERLGVETETLRRYGAVSKETLIFLRSFILYLCDFFII